MNTKSSNITFKGIGKVLAISLLLSTALSLSAPIVADANVSEKTGFIQQTEEQKQALSDKWGIELVAMRSTAAGHMVDFRYRVVDAEKATTLFKRHNKPYLLHQASGQALGVPNTAKLGPLRNSNAPQEGRTYWMFFGNHHKLVKKGDMVTVAIGDFRVTDIKVD